MKIKSYVAKNMREALFLIKQDIGPDAVIVSSRKVREKGIRGFFVPRNIEVTAAVDENNQPDGLQEELGQIKKMLTNFSGSSLPKGTKKSQVKDNFSSYKVRKSLADADIDPEVIDFLLQDIEEQLPYQSNDDIKQLLHKRLLSIFKPAVYENKNNNIMAFIGPPGVGKTTTLAKIGAIFSLFNSFSISFITIDTYRVGAVEQMQIYGEIIGVTVDVVMSPNELKQAIEKNQDKDIILIDTAGRPSKNLYQLAELKTFLEVVDPIDIYLVMNSTIKKRDMVRMLNDYKTIGYSKLVFTKIDETESLGSILNAAYFTGLPVAYITNGQDVPDDIETANPELLASLVLRDVVL